MNNIFTIGDKIKLPNENTTNIESFYLECNNLWVKTTNQGTWLLNQIEHAKSPLFTTEDGVDIYEGDEYYFIVTPEHPTSTASWKLLGPVKSRGCTSKTNGSVYFSDEQNAQKWLEENKPRYSKKDIKEACKKLTNKIWGGLSADLEKLLLNILENE